MALVLDYNIAYAVIDDINRNGIDVEIPTALDRIDSLQNAIAILRDQTGFENAFLDISQRISAVRLSLSSFYTLSGDIIPRPKNSRRWTEDQWLEWMEQYLSCETNTILASADKILQPALDSLSEIFERLSLPEDTPPVNYRNNYGITNDSYFE